MGLYSSSSSSAKTATALKQASYSTFSLGTIIHRHRSEIVCFGWTPSMQCNADVVLLFIRRSIRYVLRTYIHFLENKQLILLHLWKPWGVVAANWATGRQTLTYIIRFMNAFNSVALILYTFFSVILFYFILLRLEQFTSVTSTVWNAHCFHVCFLKINSPFRSDHVSKLTQPLLFPFVFRRRFRLIIIHIVFNTCCECDTNKVEWWRLVIFFLFFFLSWLSGWR